MVPEAPQCGGDTDGEHDDGIRPACVGEGGPVGEQQGRRAALADDAEGDPRRRRGRRFRAPSCGEVDEEEGGDTGDQGSSEAEHAGERVSELGGVGRRHHRGDQGQSRGKRTWQRTPDESRSLRGEDDDGGDRPDDPGDLVDTDEAEGAVGRRSESEDPHGDHRPGREVRRQPTPSTGDEDQQDDAGQDGHDATGGRPHVCPRHRRGDGGAHQRTCPGGAGWREFGGGVHES